MKRLFFVSICLVANSCAMQPAAAPAGDAVVIQVQAPDQHGVHTMVPFTRAQAERLAFFKAALGSGGDVLTNGFILGTFKVPWKTVGILNLVRDVTDHVTDAETACNFMQRLPGDQACLLRCALESLEFDDELLNTIKDYVAEHVLSDVHLCAQSFAPIASEAAVEAGLPQCAFSELLVRDAHVRQTLLPARVLCRELVTRHHVHGELIAADKMNRFMAVRDTSSRQVSVYSLATGRRVGKPISGRNAQFSPDGSMVWIGGENFVEGRCRLTLHATGTMEKIGQPVFGESAEFSPDGHRLLVQYGDENGQPCLALYSTCNMRRLRGEISGDFGKFSPDSQVLWTKTPGYGARLVSFYNAITGKVLGDPMPGAYVVFSPNGQYAAVHRAHEMELCQLPTLRRICILPAAGVAHFSPDGRMIFTDDIADDDGHSAEMRVIDEVPDADGGMHFVVRMIEDPVPGLAGEFSPDGTKVSVLSWDKGAGHFFVRPYVSQAVSPIGKPVSGDCMRFSPDGRHVFVADTNAWSGLYDIATGTLLGSVAQSRSPRFSPDGQLLVVSDSSHVVVYTVPGLKELARFEKDQAEWLPAREPIFLADASAPVVAIGRGAEGARIVRFRLDTAEQVAALIALCRAKATGEVAAALEGQQGWISKTVARAPVELQKFVRA